MTARELLVRLDHFFKEPDGVQKFRRLVVDLAIRGAFASKDNPQPCSASLMERVQIEKQKRLKEPFVPLPPVTAEEIPIKGASVPFVRLSEVARIEKGETGIQKAEPGKYPLVSLAAERATCNCYQIDAKAAIVPLISSSGHGHASMKRLHYQEGRFALANILCAVIPFAADAMSARFIYEYLSAYKEPLLVSKMIGTANVSLTIGKIAATPFPVVCPAAQMQVEELMRLCDKYEIEWAKREKRRDQLVTASLHRLSNYTNSDQGSSGNTARFYLQHLPRLTARSEHIQQLRQAIFNLAVRGSLTSHLADDPEAQDEIKKIFVERDRLIKQGDMRALKEIPAVTKNEISFDLPANWVWCRLGNLTRTITSGSRGWAQFYSAKGAKFIRAQNIRFGRLELDDIAYVDLPSRSEGARTRVHKNDLFVVITGAGVTNPAWLGEDIGEAYVSQHVGLIRLIDPYLAKWVLTCLMATAACRGELLEYAYGAKPGLNLDNLRLLKVPLPPRREQEKILSRLDELMNLCEQLDARLIEGAIASHALLESIVQQTVVPDNRSELTGIATA